MTKKNFKNSVIALAIGLSVISCGGRNSNAQQSGGSSEAANVETGSTAQVAGSMDAFSEEDMYEISQRWIDNFPMKNLGKPKGSKVEMASAGEDIFTMNFECANPPAVCVSYAKAVWDLNKGIAEKGELLIYVGGDTRYKPADNFAQTKYEDSENYSWYYYSGGVLWETTVRVFNDKLIKLTVEKD